MRDKIEVLEIKSNGKFGIINDQFKHEQHPNQQNGLDIYVDVLNFKTEMIGRNKLYKTKKGLCFKSHGTHYLKDFTDKVYYIPFQIIPKTNGL